MQRTESHSGIKDMSAIDTLVLATHNPGKVIEISELLANFGIKVVSAGELCLPEPEENGATFAENAAIKAHAAARAAGLPALADDSGLCVNALGGEPGVYSARWAGPEKDFGKAMASVHEKLGNAADRAAFFVCALALAWPDGTANIFEGRCNGTITWPPRGEKGFGYDPFFIPDGENRTFAEMSADEKKAISHRSKAFEKLIETCFATVNEDHN
jgi:XTP/dITP diphosphohydrolase